MTLTTGLELHLKLDDVGTQAADSSGKGRNGTVNGTVTPVWDATFGRCARFDGSGGFLAVGDPFTAPAAFTVALWVMPDPTNGTSVGLIGRHGDAQPKPSLAFSGRGLKYASAASTGGTQFGAVLADFYPAESEWVHVAWVKDGTAYRFYRNAALVDTKTAPSQVFTSATTPWWIGKDGGPGQTGSFKGRIAAVRVYSRALTQAELWEVTETDRVVPFRATHPIGFELLDENDQNALYIENPQSGKTHEVDLVIRNTSGGPIYLQPLGVTAPTELKHHFELRFRPGVLGNMAMQGLALSGDAQWKASAPQTTADGVSVYLMRADGAAAWAMAAGSAVTLQLKPLCAAPEGGTRGTRVELRTRSVTDGPSAASPIDETRTLPVSIINHLGVKNLPLHAGFVGPGMVLNDGSTANTLTLRITNTLRADTDYPDRAKVELSTATRLVLTAEAAPNATPTTTPWALAKASELDNVSVVVSHGPGLPAVTWSVTRNPLGASPEWTLQPPAQVVLDGREYLDITLSGLKTSLRAGVAYLTVHYQNVPGYWDGQWVLPVEKSLLHFPPFVVSSNGTPTGMSVGVGTATPRGFHVALPEHGGTGAPANTPGVMLSGGPTGNASIELRNNGTGTPYLDFSQSTTADYDGRLVLSGPGRLAFYGSGTFMLGVGGEPAHTLDVHGGICQRGTEFVLGRYETTKGNSGYSRALVKDTGPQLTLNYAGDFTGGVQIQGPSVAITGSLLVGATSGSHRVTVAATSDHLQLRREAAAPVPASGNVIHLELYQEKRTDGGSVHPCIRFHQSNRFWNRIEGRPEGIMFKEGHPDDNALIDIHARKAFLTEITIGGTTIGAAELNVLKKLATGTLEFDLVNVQENEYAYAFNPFNSQTGAVHTYGPGGRPPQSSRWRIGGPA